MKEELLDKNEEKMSNINGKSENTSEDDLDTNTIKDISKNNIDTSHSEQVQRNNINANETKQIPGNAPNLEITPKQENNNFTNIKTNAKAYTEPDTKPNIKTIIKNIPNTRIFPLLLGIILLLKTIFLYKFVLFTGEKLEFKMVYMSLDYIAIFMIIPMLLKPRAQFWCSMLINLLVSILLCINEIYFCYSSNLVSVSQISNLQYGKEISAALPNLINFRQLIYFIDIIAVIILLSAKKIKINKNAKGILRFGILYAIGTIIIASRTIPNWIEEADKHKYNKLMQIDASSLYGYHFLDISHNLNMKKNVKYKTKTQMLQAYNELKDEYNSEYILGAKFNEIAKDKNVIMLQLESVQNFVVNREINGYEITPNLNKFLQENIEFSNMQNQSYSSTADSEFGVMNSLYPLENGMSFAQYPSNDYNNMYQNFKNSGYTTTYIHGNDGGFWNRQAVYSRVPIDNLLFDNVFKADTERINGYISDEELYKKVVEELKGYSEKFFINIVAASSHIPFELEGMVDRESKLNFDPGEEFRDMFFGNYLEAVNYADYAFGLFIDDLKKAGLYEDTVILIYGDHAGLQMYNYEMMDFMKEVQPLNDIQTQINYSNVLCGMRIPGVESMKITKPVSKIDIKPTFAQICGSNDQFSLGMSMFSNKNFVCINNGRIITDLYFYDGDWYYIDTGEQVDLSKISEEENDRLNNYCDCLQKELDISFSINILNLCSGAQRAP